MFNFKKIASSLQVFIHNQAKKEITIFPKNNFSFSFKPFLAAQGLVVILFVAATVLFFIPHKSNQSLVIKNVVTKQSTNIVANGNPIEWTALIKRSDIKQGQYLLKLPKSAKNIKITTISVKQADDILSAEPKNQLSLKQREEIAVATQRVGNKSIFAKLTTFLFADLEQAASDVVQNVVEAITQPGNPDITQSSDSIVINLSDQTPAPTICTSDADCSSGQVCSNGSCAAAPAPAETPAPTICTSDADCSSGQVCSNGSCAAAPAPTPPEIPIETKDNNIQPPAQNTEENLNDQNIPPETLIVEENPPQEEYVQVTYETPSPVITEQATDTGKLVTVSADEQPNQPPLVDVLASTKIPEIYKIGQESKIQIKWKSENNQEVAFHAYDTDNNGKLDYVEWTVPHLSEQIFQIIFISKAFELDESQNILADIYDQVKTKDGIFASVAGGHYVRYTFDRPLDNTRDNTIYAKPTNPSQPVTIEVYPVYVDENGNAIEGQKLATFPIVDHEDTYRILLTELQTPTDVFDMKITGNVDVDFIVDPTPSGDPASELVEPADANSVGNLQTIIGTPNDTTQSTSTLFNYLRKLEQDRLNTEAAAVAENTTDAGKLEDLLGTSGAAENRVTIFNYIHKIYTALANLVAGNIKNGTTIGGLTGTYQGGTVTATGQVTSYATNDDGTSHTGLALSYAANGDGTVTDNNTGLMWVQEPQKIIPGAALAGIATNQIQVAKGDWATSTSYALGDLVRDAGGVNATAMNITGVTTANPAVVTVDNLQGITSGQSVFIQNITWSAGSGLNGNIYYVLVNATAKTLTLYSNVSLGTGVNNTATYSSGGTATQTKFYVCAIAHTSGTFTTDVASGDWVETVWTASAANLTTPSTMAWLPTGGTADAINNCENLTYAGYTDWRLPNIKELFSLALEAAGAITGVKASGAPYINQTVFPNTVSSYYWSSTTYPRGTTHALYVYFYNGYAAYTSKISAYYIRCVRGQ